MLLSAGGLIPVARAPWVFWRARVRSAWACRYSCSSPMTSSSRVRWRARRGESAVHIGWHPPDPWNRIGPRSCMCMTLVAELGAPTRGRDSRPLARLVVVSPPRSQLLLLGDPGCDLGAGGEAELGEDVFDVGFCGALGNDQLGRDVPV